MSALRKGFGVILLAALAGFCGREVVFIGLSGNGGPAIEGAFIRLFEERLSVHTGLFLQSGPEAKRLQERIDGFTYPVLTPELQTTLRRFSSDTAYIIWGMVKKCSFKPVRRYCIGAAINAELVVGLTIFNRADSSIAYAGDATASVTRLKEFVFFTPVDKSLFISAADKAEILDELAVKGVSAADRLFNIILIHETSGKKKRKPLPPEIETKNVEIIPTPVLEKRNPPVEETIQAVDSAQIDEQLQEFDAGDSTAKKEK